MTANQDKHTNDKQGHSGDVQARQSDDGSFELVVENTAASTAADSADGATSARPRADASQSRSRGFRRLTLALVAVFAIIGAVVFAFSSNDKSSQDETEAAGDSSAADFRPYQGGPNNVAANAAPSQAVEEPESAADPGVDEGEVDEEIAAEQGDFEEEWEPEQDGEVVVIEEEHPPEELDDEPALDRSDDASDDELQAQPEVDTSQLKNLHERVNLPIRAPKLNRIPTPNLEKIEMAPGGERGDGYVDEEGDYLEDRGEEYDSNEGRLDDYDEGY